MEAMRQSWSDDRLDDLSGRVDAGFARLEQRLDASDGRLEAIAERMDRRIDESAPDLRLEFNTRFDRLESRFDRMQQTLIVTGGGIVATLIAACVVALVG
jgi:hypothetical protein